MDFYQAEYEDYWSRRDRWGTDSYTNVEQVLVPLLASCGRGRTLDIGCGMGRLVKMLVTHGVDAHGMDVSERVIAHHRQTWPDRFHHGSALALPFGDGAFDTIVSCDCFEHISPDDLVVVVGELARVARRHVFLTISTALDRDQRWHLTVRSREWWEQLFCTRGYRRHPLRQRAVPFVGLDSEPWQIPLVFEKDPAPSEPGIEDWGRRCDRPADAMMAFYSLGAAFVRPGAAVFDARCGTGFGSAVLAASCPQALVVGADACAPSVDYAQRHYGASYENLTFAAHEANAPAQAFDVVVLDAVAGAGNGPEAWDSGLAGAAAATRPGGTVVVRVPAGPGAVTDSASASATWSRALDDYLAPPVPGLSIRHVFALRWNETRDLKELKLPLLGPAPDADAWILVFERERATDPVWWDGPARDTVVILAHHRSGDHYAAFLRACPFPVQFVQQFGVDWQPPLNAGLVMSLEAYDEPGVSALRRSVEAGVPTLVLADGILEYRNTWAHPQNVPGAMMQPVIGHKVACIGPSQARLLESWGNAGRCEVIGAPRFDRYLTRRPAPRLQDGPFRVLIATAKTPYFTPDQREHVVRGLRALRAYFAHDAAGTRPAYDVSWRIAPDLAADLGLGDGDRLAQQPDVADALGSVDALITTPSTLALEGMLTGLPVAILDFGNAPAYYSTAWRIDAAEHIEPALRAMRTPSQAERLFQEYSLHDLCACTTPAVPRLVTLVSRMIEIGRDARKRGLPLTFPATLVPRDPQASGLPDNAFDLARLYPDHSLFRRNHTAALQYEVALLRSIVGSRESDLNRFDKALRDFDAELKTRHEAVSSFERDLLAYKEDLAARERAVTAQADRLADWWGASGAGFASVPRLLRTYVRSVATSRAVVCWGAGEMGRQVLEALGDAAASVSAFVDSNPARQGTAWGKPVVAPAALWASGSGQRPFVLLASMHAGEIAADLRAHGFEPDADYLAMRAIG